jgi:uncharacterized membrane protein
LSQKVTLKEAAQKAGYPYPTVWRRYQEGLIPAEKVGRTIVCDVETVKAVFLMVF